MYLLWKMVIFQPGMLVYQRVGGGNSNILGIFTRILGEMIQFDEHISSDGWGKTHQQVGWVLVTSLNNLPQVGVVFGIGLVVEHFFDIFLEDTKWGNFRVRAHEMARCVWVESLFCEFCSWEDHGMVRPHCKIGSVKSVDKPIYLSIMSLSLCQLSKFVPPFPALNSIQQGGLLLVNLTYLKH